MKMQFKRSDKMRVVTVLMLFFLYLPLISCNSNGQETRESEDGMMQHEMMDGCCGGMGGIMWVWMILVFIVLVLLIIWLVKQIRK